MVPGGYDYISFPTFHESIGRAAAMQTAGVEPKMAKIAEYNGEAKDYRRFTGAIDMRFTRHRSIYVTGHDRITCIIELLTGRARQWGDTIMLGGRPDLMMDYPAFVAEFKNQWEDKQYISRQQHIFFKVPHTYGSVANFAIDFETAAFACGFGHNVMAPQFELLMQGPVKDALAQNTTVDRANYHELKQFCVQVHENLFRRNIEVQRQQPRQPTTYTPNPGQQRYIPPPGRFGQAPQVQGSVAPGKCYNCNVPGHISRYCPHPQRPRQPQVQNQPARTPYQPAPAPAPRGPKQGLNNAVETYGGNGGFRRARKFLKSKACSIN